MDHFSPQFFCLSLLLLVSFLFCIFRFRRWSSSTGQSPSQSCRLPPSPTAFPIIGHLHLLTDMPHITFTRLAQKLGPSPNRHNLVLSTGSSGPQNPRPRLRNPAAADLSSVPILWLFRRLLFPSGPYWRQARKICVTELLSSKRVNSFQLVRDEEVNRMLDWIRNQSGSKLNLSKVFITLVNDVLCRVAFGKRFGNNCDLLDVLTETNVLLSGFCMGDFFPQWKWVHSVSGMKKRLEKNLNDLRKICDAMINERLQNNESKTTTTICNSGEDFLDVLLRMQQRDDLEVPITDENIKALVMDMFEGGTDTTTATLEWTMIELVRHPRVMKKAQEEVRKVASETGKVNETHLQHLHYMKAVVKETLRLHPPTPLLPPRESMDKCILDGFEIPAKTRVVINVFAIGRDPKSWKDPLVYNPERFIDDHDNKNGSVVDIDHVKDQEFKFVPFGGGRRGCPGFAFGLATIEIALARLLCHFDWELPPEVLGPHDVDHDQIFGLASRKKSTLVLVPKTNRDFPLVHV